MAQLINTNISSMNAQRQLSHSQRAQQTAMERLSSGLRINSAKDDAAGLSISDRMTSQIKGLNQAVRNANDGISLAQTAEGAMEEVTNALQRMRELAVQSANDTNSGTDRVSLQKEVAQLQQEITRIARTTQFNGKNLLDGTFTSQKFQIGANADQTISVALGSVSSNSIGAYNLSTNTNIGAALAPAANLSGGNGVAAQTLTINGKTSTTASVTAGMAASEIAGLVNGTTGSSGVSAAAKTSVSLAGVAANGTVSFTLSSSTSAGTVGTAQAISASVTTTDLTNLADAINAASGSTNITATLSANKSSITLESADGYNINVLDGDNSGVAAAATAFTVGGQNITKTDGATATATDSIVVGGQVTYQSDTSYTVATSAGTTVMAAASNNSTLSAVGATDISTQSGANSAISVFDKALSYIDNARANLGALQNRFNSTISNLQNVSENTSSARSRIRDADFAAETAELSRNQVLQQAGMAMLAQANAAPQSVLSLLRG